MKFVTVSELKQRATQIVSEIETSGEEVIVTKLGKPVVLLQRITEADLGLKPRDRKEKER